MKHARVAYDGAVRSGVVILEERLLRFADGRIAGFDEVVWLPPIQPRTVFALGLNYADHAAELSFKQVESPLIFLKGSNAFVGHSGSSVCPRDVLQMHPECELGVVIGRKGRHIRRESAFDYVAGYTVANDYALREYLENYYRPNLRVKNRDGCTPIGPWMVDASDVSDPTSLDLRTFVNGELVQHGNTRGMIFDIPAIIEYLSDFMTLSPGDLILTGTPQGVRFVKAGDEVVTEIEGIGRLLNRVIDEVTVCTQVGTASRALSACLE